MPRSVTAILREQSAERAEAFVNSYKRAFANRKRLSEDLAKDISETLKILAKDARARALTLGGSGEGPFLQRMVAPYSEQIGRLLAEWADDTNRKILAAEVSAFDEAAGMAFDAFDAAGASIAFPSVNREILTVLGAQSGTLITELSDNIVNSINNFAARAASGLLPTSSIIQSIEDYIGFDDAVIAGIPRRTKIHYQAEMIARTEVGRVWSAAQHSASLQIAETVPGLKKRWVTSGLPNTRRGHKEAEATYAEGGEKGPIAIKTAFVIKDYSRSGRTPFLTVKGRIGLRSVQRVVRTKEYTRRGIVKTARLMFPRDPSAPPGFVVNCNCDVFDVVPGFEEAEDKALGIVQAGPEVTTGPQYREFDSIEGCEDWARDVAGVQQVRYKGLDVKSANLANRSLYENIVLKKIQPPRAVRVGAGHEFSEPGVAAFYRREVRFERMRDAEGRLVTREIIEPGELVLRRKFGRNNLWESSLAEDLKHYANAQANVQAGINKLDASIAKADALIAETNRKINKLSKEIEELWKSGKQSESLALAGEKAKLLNSVRENEVWKRNMQKAKEKYLSDLAEGLFADRHNVGRHYGDLVTHELAHHIHSMGGGIDSGVDVLGGQPFAFGGHYPLTGSGRDVAIKISKYATTNTAEHFAEAYTAMVVGEIGRVSPAVVEFIERTIERAIARGATT